LVRLDLKHDLPPEIRIERLDAIKQMRPLACVHHDDAFGVIDHPYVRGKPIGPLRVDEDAQSPAQTASAPSGLRSLDSNGPGLNGVDPHAPSMIGRTMSGRSKCTRWPASGTRTAVVPGPPITPGNSPAVTAPVSASCSPNTKWTGTMSCGGWAHRSKVT